jgi:SIR2-like domain
MYSLWPEAATRCRQLKSIEEYSCESSVLTSGICGDGNRENRYPSVGAPDEYAELFEAVYPAEADRRTYLDSKIAGSKPSYGHIALATLMKAKMARLVWTTNFDPLVADACAKIYDGTGYLTTVALDAPALAQESIHNERWPIEVKLHGDFRSRRLKNTSDEFRLQDEELRHIFVESCSSKGLVVAGYSGRDSSVMAALEEALEKPGAYPAGLFWLHRGDDRLFESVERLLSSAVNKGIDAAIVRIDSFDETMRDLVRLQSSSIDTAVLDVFAAERARRSAAPYPTGNSSWPVLRFNALPLLQTPTVCRKIVCSIGGYSEVRKALEAAGIDALTARTRAGVLAFGSDEGLRSAFGPFGITDFDLHTIETKRLRYESGERGLLRDALTRSIIAQRGLTALRKGSVDLLVPQNPQDAAWEELRNQVGTLTGKVKAGLDIKWHEGVGVRLDWANDRLWLMIEPRIVFSGITADDKAIAADFARERTVRRYNRQLNSLIGFWSKAIARDGSELRALSIGNGVDAVFRLDSNTAYSRRAIA